MAAVAAARADAVGVYATLASVASEAIVVGEAVGFPRAGAAAAPAARDAAAVAAAAALVARGAAAAAVAHAHRARTSGAAAVQTIAAAVPKA